MPTASRLPTRWWIDGTVLNQLGAARSPDPDRSLLESSSSGYSFDCRGVAPSASALQLLCQGCFAICGFRWCRA